MLYEVITSRNIHGVPAKPEACDPRLAGFAGQRPDPGSHRSSLRWKRESEIRSLFDPRLEILFRAESRRFYEYEPFERFSREVHLSGVGSGQGCLVSLGTDAYHELVARDPAALV